VREARVRFAATPTDFCLLLSILVLFFFFLFIFYLFIFYLDNRSIFSINLYPNFPLILTNSKKLPLLKWFLILFQYLFLINIVSISIIIYAESFVCESTFPNPKTVTWLPKWRIRHKKEKKRCPLTFIQQLSVLSENLDFEQKIVEITVL